MATNEEIDELTPLTHWKTIEPDAADYGFWGCMNTQEPFTKNWKAESPTPLKLLGKSVSTMALQATGIFGAYAFLVSQQDVMFPQCEKHAIIAKLMGHKEGEGYICHTTAWFLWNFPLVCCMVIPFYQYWRYCDKRLYYECLRNKILLNFVPENFFTSPAIIFMTFWLLGGMSTLLFSNRDTPEEWRNTLIVLVPFLLPVAQFYLTMYLTWDIKYFLITLANFADEDAEWAEKHLGECVPAFENDLYVAYKACVDDGILPPKGAANSAEVFRLLRDELRKGTPRVQRKRMTAAKDLGQRIKGLLFLRPGFWMLDLLWMPADSRSWYFRASFWIFGAFVWLIEAFFLYMITVTTVTHLVHQELVDPATIPARLLWLGKFAVNPVAHG